MQIIKHGEPRALPELKTFKCSRCGCVFATTRTEYEVKFWRNDYIYKAVCPECGYKTVRRG